ncbi:hypothetical protein ACVGOW_20320 [Pseudonocardia saturnea]
MTGPDRTIRTTDPLATNGDTVAPSPAEPTPPPARTPAGGATAQPADTGRDRVRWGPIWAGAVVVLPVFLLLQLLFFALGWLDLGYDAGGSATAAVIVGSVLGLLAFLVGGLTAAASTMWSRASDGILQGVLVWALSVVIVLVLMLIGGTVVLGPLANVLLQTSALAQGNVPVDPAQVLGTLRMSAGWAALGLGLSAGAAALGGLAGSKLWSSRRANGART